VKPPISPRNNRPVREVIGTFSAPKVGKSTAWRAIAQYEKATGSEATFYVIDTDGDAAERLLSGCPDLDNIKLLRAKNWETWKIASRIAKEEAGEGDWIVIDLADRVWKMVQNYYTRMVHHRDALDDAEYLLHLRAQWEGERKGAQKRSSTEGWDWGYINGLYDASMLPLILDTPAHVYLTTEQADYQADLEQDKAKRMMFGKIGVKMTGQKSLPYQVATILHFDVMAGKRVITTVGDRDGPTGPRAYLEKAEMKDFVQSYLIGVAGWTMA
jgi:hypothetical protein